MSHMYVSRAWQSSCPRTLGTRWCLLSAWLTVLCGRSTPSPGSLSISSVRAKVLSKTPPAEALGGIGKKQLEINKVPSGQARSWQGSRCFFKYSWPRGSARPRGSSDGDPHCVHLVLESQQAVGNAFLVAGQPHPDLLDVTVVGGREGESEAGVGKVGSCGMGPRWGAEEGALGTWQGARASSS